MRTKLNDIAVLTAPSAEHPYDLDLRDWTHDRSDLTTRDLGLALDVLWHGGVDLPSAVLVDSLDILK